MTHQALMRLLRRPGLDWSGWQAVFQQRAGNRTGRCRSIRLQIHGGYGALAEFLHAPLQESRKFWQKNPNPAKGKNRTPRVVCRVQSPPYVRAHRHPPS